MDHPYGKKCKQFASMWENGSLESHAPLPPPLVPDKALQSADQQWLYSSHCYERQGC